MILIYVFKNTGCSFIIVSFVFLNKNYWQKDQRESIPGSGRNVKMCGFTRFPITTCSGHTGDEVKFLFSLNVESTVFWAQLASDQCKLKMVFRFGISIQFCTFRIPSFVKIFRISRFFAAKSRNGSATGMPRAYCSRKVGETKPFHISPVDRFWK